MPGSRAGVAPALVVLSLYVGLAVVGLARHGWDPTWFLWIGPRYADLDPSGGTGYDGQFTYYLARDGAEAIVHLDNPPYRLQRILHPALAWAAALGRDDLLVWTIPMVGLVAIVAGTAALGLELERRGVSPWYALTFGLFIGTLLGYIRALVEPLAFGLAACALVAWARGWRTPGAILLAGAMLAKETAALFALGLVVERIARGDRRGAALALATVAPLAAWEAYLVAAFGVVPPMAGPGIAAWPLGGILVQLTLEPGRLAGLVLVAIPALALLLWLAVRRPIDGVAYGLAANCVLALFFPVATYDHVMHAARNAMGVALGATLLLPVMAPRLRTVILLVAAAPWPVAALWALTMSPFQSSP